jgi:hypothetical protein
MKRRKQAVTFLKKSNRKTFINCGRWRLRCHNPQLAKVFWLLFFKKVTAFLLFPHHA